MPSLHTLVLVPTESERTSVRAVLEATGATVELCGFGLVAAAARTSQLLANRAPQRVLLLGIAGALSQELEIGAAYSFQEVACFGVGAGSGQDFRSAAMMGWSHWPGPPRIDDCLPLEGPASGLQLLTCCSASGNSQDASLHLEAFPVRSQKIWRDLQLPRPAG